MRKTLLVIGGLIGLLLTAPKSEAQDSTVYLKLSSVVRQRGEFLDSYERPRVDGETPLLMVGQYTNVGLSFCYKGVKSHFSLQDGRAWGRKYGEEAPSVYLAWVDVPLGEHWNIIAGRQALNLFGGWLFSTGRGAMMWKSWDMAQVYFHTGGLQLRAYGMVNSESLKRSTESYYDGFPFRYLAMLRGEYRINEQITIRSVVIDDWSQHREHPARYYGRITASLGGAFKLSDYFSGFVDGYYQGGEHIAKGQEKARSVSAYAVNGMLNSQFAAFGKAYIGLHMMSGNSAGTNTEKSWHQFDRLVGAGHRIYSNMDYFDTKLSTLQGLGLWDSYIGTTLTIGKGAIDTRVGVFTLDKVPSTYDRYLGTVVDVTANYQIQKWLSAELCYSFMLGSKGLEKFYPNRRNNWGQLVWLTLEFTPWMEWRK